MPCVTEMIDRLLGTMLALLIMFGYYGIPDHASWNEVFH